MRVYEAIVRALESVGVEAAFGGAGENAAGLMIALKNAEKMQPIITKNEQAASFMACGYAMFTNRIGFCFATAGPGAFNLFSGLAVALSDSYPVLAVTGYAAMKWQGKGALNETSGKARTPDSQAMFAATTKGSFLLDDISKTCDVVEAAVNLACEGRPGPVHIHVPEDLTLQGQSVDNYRDITLSIRPVEFDPAQLAQAAAALDAALRQGKKVLALAGFGARRAGPALTTVLEQYQIPLVTTMDGKGVLAETHPLCVGIFCDSGQPTAWRAFLAADVILAIGNSFAQHATFDFKSDLMDGKSLIHINICANEIGKVYQTDHAVAGDAALVLPALRAALENLSSPAQSWMPDKHDYAAEHIIHLGGKIHPGQLVQTLSANLPANAIVLADAGAHAAWLGYYTQLSVGQNFRKPGSFGPMACNVNGALGVQLANPGRRVIAGCGDGGYLLSGFELMTAVQYGIPVIWIIFNDGEFKLIKLYQLQAFHEAALVDFQNPDYVAYAQACGAAGFRAETLDEFETALKAALTSNKPSIIDARITRFAVPHYSSTPEGVLAGALEMIEQQLHL